MKKLLDTLTQAALLVFLRLAFLPLAFLPLIFLLLAGCGEVINVYTTSAERPALELEVGSGGEWTESIAFTAILAEATTKDVTFSYATELDGTADEEDLVSVTGKATIRAGETEVSVIVQVLDDYHDDNDETFSFVLSQANTELINGEDSITAIATILDDDYSNTPLQLVQFDDASIKEGDGYTVNRATFDIILNRSVLAHENVSFDYIVIGETARVNEDYISIQGTADISLSDRASLSISIVGDYVAEDRLETFRLILSNPVGFEITPELDGVAVGTIIDNDKLVLESFSDVFKVEDNANSNMEFDVILSRPVQARETVSFHYVVEDGTAKVGSDYTAVPATTLYFDVSEDRATIVVEIIGDDDDEEDYESFTVKLSELVGISTIPAVDLIATGIIQDDDGAQGLLKDVDGDGLLDIFDAYMLNNIRYNLAGTSYKTSESATGITTGCNNSRCYGYELLGDIFLPPTNWVPVGSPANPFTATLEGNGFTISNLKISSGSDMIAIGFISTLDGGAGTVRNLNFAAGSVSSEYRGNVGGENYLGGVVGQIYASSSIENVSSALSVSVINGRCYHVGGLVGKSTGWIANSSSSGNVDSNRSKCYSLGGLVGANGTRLYGRIKSSYATGNVGGNGSKHVGGLVGVNYSTILTSYATGNVGGNSSWNVGGLVGINHSSILTSYATGNVDGNGNVGGLVGINRRTIGTSYATGSVTSKRGSNVGGLVGRNMETIYESHTGDMVAGTKAGNVVGNNLSRVGGLVGNFYAGIIKKSYATGDVYSTFSGQYENEEYYGLGGLVGLTYGYLVVDSYATGNVTGSKGNEKIGGLVGNIYRYGRLKDSYATGNVTGGGGNDKVGGLVGEIRKYGNLSGNSATGTVSGNEGNDKVGGLVGSFDIDGARVNRDNYATGDVSGNEGNDYVGGLIGKSNNGIISSYASGNVIGDIGNDFVGGLVGFTSAFVRGSYAIGTVDGNNGTDSVGGLAGFYAREIRNSFATGIVSGGEGNDRVGGLSGATDTGSIRNSYAIGAVNGNLGDDYVGGIVGRINLGSLKNSYAIGAVDGGAGTDKIGFLTGFKGTSADIAGNYYLMGGGLTNGTALSLATTEAIGKSKANLKALTIAITGNDFTEGWSNFNWNLTANDKYPSLKSYKEENDAQVEGDLLCSQSSEHVQC